MASRIEIPCASRSDGRTATVRSAVRAETSSRRPVNTTRSETARPRDAAWARSASASEPSPTIASQASGAASRIIGIAAIRNRWPFSGSRRATTPISGACRGMPNSSRIRQAGTGRREPLEIDAVRDDREAGVSASLATHLVLDARRRNDQPIHPRRQRRQQRDVLGRADARGVDGGHDHRRAGGDGRASPDHLGAEHVGVDEVDLVVAQPAGKLSHGQRVVALVQDIHGEAERP